MTLTTIEDTKVMSSFVSLWSENSQRDTAVVMHNVLGYILPLTTRLQSSNVDIVSAYKEGREVAEVIESLRSEERYSTIYQQAVQLASTIDVVLVKKKNSSTTAT